MVHAWQVILAGHPTDPSWTASDKWTDDYLIHTARDTPIKVEVRKGKSDQFGRDNKTEMSFAEFVGRVASGDDTLYLTTQAVKAAPDGFPELHAGPVTRLADDFPTVPSLLGGLVPQNINLWMGAAPDGASSGLHHDFHDNLYVLLRGRKRFRLYSPELATRMYTHGCLRIIYPNGRIVYDGDDNIREDGADADDAAAWESRHCNDRQPGENGGSDDEALEEALDNAMAGDIGLEDDYVGSDDDDDTKDFGEESDAGPGGGAASEPPSFSKVDLLRSDAEIAAEFPLFPGRKAAVVAELMAGDCLFLPAGWFHEVTSASPAEGGGHLALNYWMHPPDALDRGPATAASPYRHKMWPQLWRERQRRAGQTVGVFSETTPPQAVCSSEVAPSTVKRAIESDRPKTKRAQRSVEEAALGFGDGAWLVQSTDVGGCFDAEEAGLDALLAAGPVGDNSRQQRKQKRPRPTGGSKGKKTRRRR